MTAVGARGETRRVLADLIGAPESVEEQNRQYARLLQSVHGEGERPFRKRMVEPVLVPVVTFRARFSFPVSRRSCPCPKVSPAIPVRNSTGAT
jgi:hypothetical protein